MSPDVWKNRSVFITGHTGFKGGWLSLWLHSAGAKVTGYALDPETNPCFFERTKLGEKIQDIRGDINSHESLFGAMTKSSPDVVFHLAAQPLVRRSYREPVKTYMDNVMGTISVLEAVRKVPTVKVVVVITTDKCYENREQDRPYIEDDPLGGYDPYSSSKACAEIATAAWRRSFFQTGARVVTVRAGNVIGGGDWSEDRLIPDAVRSVNEKRALSVRHPEAVRPWQHVLDPLNGYLVLAEKLLAGSDELPAAFNFGPSNKDSRSVRDVLSLVKENWGPDFEWKSEADPQSPHEAGLLKLDSSRAHEVLGWTPRWRLAQGIAQTVAWYRMAMDPKSDMYDFSWKQIQEFLRG